MDSMYSTGLDSKAEVNKYFRKFLFFLASSRTTRLPTKSLYAVATVEYNIDCRGERLQDTTTFKTKASPVRFNSPSSLSAMRAMWWKDEVSYPIRYPAHFDVRFGGSPVVWWKDEVLYPLQNVLEDYFIHTLDCYLVNITYVWDNE